MFREYAAMWSNANAEIGINKTLFKDNIYTTIFKLKANHESMYWFSGK